MTSENKIVPWTCPWRPLRVTFSQTWTEGSMREENCLCPAACCSMSSRLLTGTTPPQPRLRPLKTSPFLHGYELRSRPTPKPQPAEGRTNAQGCPACTRAEEPRRSWQLVRSNPDQSQIPPRQKLRGVLAGGQRVQRQSQWHRGNEGGPP